MCIRDSYKVVLNRAQDYQVLGSSKMTVQRAIDVDRGKTIAGNWGGDAVIRSLSLIHI